jgi:TMEM175 potassium channel family protein
MVEPVTKHWERSESETEFARVIAFTDGVIAIAITLLVLNFDTPELREGQGLLVENLGALQPTVLSYAISFAVISRFWLLHHRFFGSLDRWSTALMELNLLYLALIVLMPFTTDILDNFQGQAAAPVLYAINVAAVSTVNWLMMRYAVNRRLVHQPTPDWLADFASPYGLITPAAFLVSIPFAVFVSPLWAPAIWALALLSGARRRRSMAARRRSG